ncbi:MAG: GtrA family protein [Ktedonobacterales bacterium]|nr:GtrA family protein [Ktedonobacterales bacterium]
MRVDDETRKRQVVSQMPTAHVPVPDVMPPELVPTRKLRSIRPTGEDTLVLAGISGITPIPVRTQDDLIIDAVWFRSFHAWLDRASGGRAAKLMPLLSFLVIGGSASVLNLVIIFALDFIRHPMPKDLVLHTIYSAIATEVSLIYNFMLNDRFTFRALVDMRRSWLQRCIRFHGPASVGFVLTLALSNLFVILLPAHLPHNSVIAQAMAIVIVTAVNFTMHRFWTYRPSKSAAAAH